MEGATRQHLPPFRVKYRHSDSDSDQTTQPTQGREGNKSSAYQATNNNHQPIKSNAPPPTFEFLLLRERGPNERMARWTLCHKAP